MTSRPRISAHSAWYAVAFAALWVLLASLRPGTTYHLAPVLVAGAAPLVFRLRGGESRVRGLQLAVAGFSVAVVTTGVLALLGLLDGPSLLPFGGAAVESLVGAVVGGAGGVATAALLTPEESRELRARQG